jgi:very-short-patch-repair endonuclease
MAEVITSKKTQLTKSRQELLDLGLRNPLISLSKNRGLPIIDEISREVFRLMVIDGRSMSFLPTLKAIDELEIDDLVDENGDAREIEARHVDNKLQTALEDEKLQTKLLRLYGEARTLMEEQGINALYVALGMLHWFEDESSQSDRRAPLVLVPVDLNRGDASEKFKLKYSDAEIGENLSLSAKLREDFRVQMPTFPDVEDFDFDEYVKGVRKAISGLPRWKVREDEIVLGFFSFGKFLMYKDLDSENWPAGSKPEDNQFIDSLFGEGFRIEASTVSDSSNLDHIEQVGDLSMVMDADSSQTAAILDVRSGRNLVIQGPPGTGKSQTIANILSDALGQGKKVLFVAEKMAALDVVKRRMDSVGIGDACLELHSHKTNKKDLLKELRRTIELGAPSAKLARGEDLELFVAKERLNDYCNAVNEPIGESAVTPYFAMGKIVGLKTKLAGIEFPPYAGNVLSGGTSPGRYSEVRNLVGQVQRSVETSGPVTRHPFYGVAREIMLPSEKSSLGIMVKESQDVLTRLVESSTELAQRLRRPGLLSLASIAEAIEVATDVVEAAEFRGFPIAIDKWTGAGKAIRSIAETSKSLLAGRAKASSLFIEAAWEHNFLACRQRLSAHGRKWWRFLIADFRSSKAEFEGFLRGASVTDNDALVGLLDTVMADQQGRKQLAESSGLMKDVLGDLWDSESSNWERIEALLKRSDALQSQVNSGKCPSWLLEILSVPVDVDALELCLKATAPAYQSFVAKFNEIITFLEFENNKLGSESTVLSLKERLESWLANLDSVTQIVGLNHLKSEMGRKKSSDFFAFAMASESAVSHLVDVFDLYWFQGLIDVAHSEREELRYFSSAEQAQTVERFVELDKMLLDTTKVRLATTHWNQLPKHESGGQLGILREEFAKKRRHLPVRQLLLKAGRAVQAVKPIFMMSPMSVATYLVPKAMEFDLVVFDEASQVRPVDAIGALLRGKQAVVVGDEKQMPPTSFFDRIVSSDETEDDEVSGTADMESVLSMFLGKGCASKMLRWHYRSRHHSLIAVSNKEFYDNRLVVFPSPDVERGNVGLSLNYLPHTSYDRGGTRSNPLEARAVAEAVMRHASECPHQTLLVASFSVAQATAIEDALEVLRRQNPQLESFFSSNEHEPFLVKNLETIQGDERDVVFISIGYGKTAEGYLAMNFGPLNKDGGERRLNVLITRARSRCEVFTNLTSGDLDLTRTQAQGVSSLKLFLNYAETGILDNPGETQRDDESPFEDAVAHMLISEGLVVHRQVGSAGFFIDMAIVDPDRKGRYLLGIECDGATYHSARSARDRDRLRQAVLENLGWKLHRIWSTDWFQNPAVEIKRLFQALEQAKTSSPPKTERVENRVPVVREDSPPHTHANQAAPPASELIPYKVVTLSVRPDWRELHQVSVQELSEWIGQVVSSESPVHSSEVYRRIADAWNVQRIGSRISDVLGTAVIHAKRSQKLVQRGDFLWSPEMETPVPRSRSVLPLASRKLELVAPEEIAIVVDKIVTESFGVPSEELFSSVVRAFGFGRATADMVSIVERVVSSGLQSGRIERTNGLIQVMQVR